MTCRQAISAPTPVIIFHLAKDHGIDSDILRCNPSYPTSNALYPENSLRVRCPTDEIPAESMLSCLLGNDKQCDPLSGGFSAPSGLFFDRRIPPFAGTLSIGLSIIIAAAFTANQPRA